MLINYNNIIKRYGIPTGIIHIGGYMGEEQVYYKDTPVIWIEAIRELAIKIKRKYPVVPVINEVVSDRCEEVDFMVTNNLASSSLLDLFEHKTEHPKVVEKTRIKVKTKTMSEIVKYYHIDMSKYDFLNIDVQGAELKVLKGFDSLDNFKYIYLEVNEREMYKGCPLIQDLDVFLSGFTRIETKMTPHGWGDALYEQNNYN